MTFFFLIWLFYFLGRGRGFSFFRGSVDLGNQGTGNSWGFVFATPGFRDEIRSRSGLFFPLFGKGKISWRVRLRFNAGKFWVTAYV